MAFWVHPGITEMEERRKKKGGGAQGPEIAGAEVTNVVGKGSHMHERLGAHQDLGDSTTVP